MSHFPQVSTQLAGNRNTLTSVLGLALCFVIGLTGVFFGLDVCDSGFYLTFYDNIFKSPGSVEYNFMYYMSGIVGGTIAALFPSIGMMEMRLIGLFTLLASMVIFYLSMRRSVNAISYWTGCVMVMLAFTTPLLTFNHDLLTVFFYTLIIAAITHGIVKDKPSLLVIGGFMIGLNIFTRIPNVLSLVLVALPLLKRIYGKCTWGRAIGMTAIVLAGTAASASLVIVMMRVIGHWQPFVNNINDLFSIASSSDATHSSSQLITTQLNFYKTTLWCAAKLGACILLALATWALTTNKILRILAYALSLAAFCYMAMRMSTLNIIWIMSFVGCVAAIVRCKWSLCGLACYASLVMLVIFPMGSDSAYNNGSIIALCALPLAMSTWTKRKLLPFTTCAAIIFGGLLLTSGAYFDSGNLQAKTSTINSPRMRLTHTTPERAVIINDMLDGIAPFVKKEQTLLAYGSVPLVNFITGTRPMMGCSWPELLNAAMLEQKLNSCHETPAILRQKFNTIGPQWGQPSDTYLTQYNEHNGFLTNDKLHVLNSFMNRNKYKLVWENKYFALFVAN